MSYIGQYFWSIDPVIESGGGGVRPPWRGVVTKEYTRIDGSISHVRLCRYNAKTKEPDEDSNASAMVYVTGLFDDFESARKAFLFDLKSQAASLQEAIKRVEVLKENEWLPWQS